MKIKAMDYFDYLRDPKPFKDEINECNKKKEDARRKQEEMLQRIKYLQDIKYNIDDSIFGKDPTQIPIVEHKPDCYGRAYNFYSPLEEFPWFVQVYFANKLGWSVAGFTESDFNKSDYVRYSGWLKREYVPTKQEAFDLAIRWIQNRELENLPQVP